MEIRTSVALFGEGNANGPGAFSGTDTRNVGGVLAPRAVDADFSVDPERASGSRWSESAERGHACYLLPASPGTAGRSLTVAPDRSTKGFTQWRSAS